MCALKAAAQAILDELNSRYDGAPDFGVLWMGDHIRDLEMALKAPTIRENFQRFRGAMQEFSDLKLSLFVNRGLEVYHCISGEVRETWRLSVVGVGSFCKQSEAPDFDIALNQLVKKIRGAPPCCGVCGGRMDGECKHSHEPQLKKS